MRSVLLPQGMETEHWITLMDAVDYVWGLHIDSAKKALLKSRHSIVPLSIDGQHLQDPTTLDTLDKETLVKRVRYLGLQITEADELSVAALHRLVFSLGRYWYSKGTVRLDNYLNYVLNTTSTIIPLWTDDYVRFYPKDNPNMGISVTEGGTWYPSTHVDVEIVSASLTDVSREGFLKILYQLLPATTVIRNLTML